MLYSLNMEGYWVDQNRSAMPCYSGVYCVYACTYNASSNTVALRALLYVGQAQNVNVRIFNHEKRGVWAQHLNFGETVCYTCAYVDGRSLDVVEAALVYKLKPPVNDLLITHYVHSPSVVSVGGQWPYPALSVFSVP